MRTCLCEVSLLANVYMQYPLTYKYTVQCNVFMRYLLGFVPDLHVHVHCTGLLEVSFKICVCNPLTCDIETTFWTHLSKTTTKHVQQVDPFKCELVL